MLRASTLLAGCAIFALASPARADDGYQDPRTTTGGIGLIEMPSARMASDGQLSAGASYFQNIQHYNLGFQILPWLEGSFRYSGLQHFDKQYPVYWDRSFALKGRLWDEGDWMPAVAVGINDVVGTGIYSGEYLVASKRFGSVDTTLGIGWGRFADANTFKNPFTLVSNSFVNRPSLTTPGGTNFSVYFHGPESGVFGGVAWHTPVPGLSLMAEYSSDSYNLESSRGTFTPRNQINMGASYDVTEGVSVGLDWLYGNRISASVAFKMDPTIPQYPQFDPPPPVHVRSDEEQRNALVRLLGNPEYASDLGRAAQRDRFVDTLWTRMDGVVDIGMRGQTLVVNAYDGDPALRCQSVLRLTQDYPGLINAALVQTKGDTRRCPLPGHVGGLQPAVDRIGGRRAAPGGPVTVIDASAAPISRAQAERMIRADLRRQNLTIEALEMGPSEISVYYDNSHYLFESDALDRLTRILMQDAPPDVERFRLVPVRAGVPQREFSILRAPLEREFVQSNGNDLPNSPVDARGAPMHNPVLAAAAAKSYPRFSWGVFPTLHQALFDPNQPLGIQVLASLGASVEMLPGWSFNATGELNIYDNFNTSRTSDSELPHVRSDFVKYFTEGKNGINSLDSEYRFRLAPNVFAIAKAGYLETMFAGMGGEVLWRPEGERWALGVDAYGVQQRGYDRLVDLQHYRVFTGHVSLYYQSPWYGLNFAVRAGQYLAGDRGLTIEVTRRFATGVEIGTFATKTNVSADRFGEGSFDKGIMIRIPLGWAAPVESQAQFGMDLRPVQRDGGQRLYGDATLYEETRRSSLGEMINHSGEFGVE